MSDRKGAAGPAASMPPPAAPSAGGSSRRKNRMLKDFYGLEKTAAASNPLSLDDEAFNADLFLKKVMAERELPKLVDLDNKTVAEIKALDSDMKMLVYENYNKFISATDTIKKMRKNVENMTEDMDRMRKTMESIDRESLQVNTSLVEKRNRINQLSGVLGMLRKLQFVFELPSRLRNCLKLNAYDQAYRYYMRTSDVLSHYSHLPSFAAIQKDCDVIIKDLIVKLKAKMRGPDIGMADFLECTQILIGLKEPAQELWRAYLEREKRALQSLLASCAVYKPPTPTSPQPASGDDADADADAVPVEPPSAEEGNDPCAMVNHVNDVFCRQLADFIGSFNRVFLGALASKSSLPAPTLSQQEKRTAEEDLYVAVSDLGRDYFTLLETFLTPRPGSRLSSPPDYARTFVRMESSVATIDSLLPRSGFATKSRKLTGDFLTNYVGLTFGKVEESIKAQIVALPARIKSDEEEGLEECLMDCLRELKGAVNKGYMETLSGLDLFLHLDESFVNAHSNMFVGAVFRRALSFWPTISADMVEFGSSKSLAASAHSALVTLLLARLCLDLESTIVGNALGRVVELFGLVGRRSLTVENNDIRLSMRSLADDLLQKYVDNVAESLSYMIRNSVESRNWLTLKEPRRISKVWEQVLSDLGTMAKGADALFEKEDRSNYHARLSSDGSSRRTGATYTSSAGRGRGIGGLPVGTENIMIDRLFVEKVDVFGRVDMAKSAIKLAVIKIVLKSTVETVRTRTLGRNGFQQLQVDAEYLRINMWRFDVNERIANNMITDIVSSAQNRCVDPVPMDQSIVEKLASEVTAAH